MNDELQSRNCSPTTANAVIGKSLKYYYQNFLLLVAVCAVIFGPFEASSIYLWNYLYSEPFQNFLCQHLDLCWGIFLASFFQQTLSQLIMAIGGALFTATMIPYIVGDRERAGISFLKCISGMFRRLGSLTVVAVLSAIPICFSFLTRTPDLIPIYLELIFLVPVIFFVIVFMIVFSVAIPVLMIEKTGPIQAMKKSWVYTAGKRGEIFLVLLSVGIISAIVSYIFMKIGSGIYTVVTGYPYTGKFFSLFAKIVVSYPIGYVTIVFLYLYVKNKNTEPVVSENSVQDVATSQFRSN